MATSKTKLRELKLLEIDQEDSDKKFSYFDMCKTMLHAPKDPRTGTTTKEMRTVSPILRKLDEAGEGGTVHLIESEWKELKDRIGTFKFASNNDLVIDLEDAIKACEEVPFEKSKDTTEAPEE